MDYLDKYTPEIPLAFYEVDQSLDKVDRAFKSWELLLNAKKNYEGLFLTIGKLLKEIRDQKLYITLDYDTFTQFLSSPELGFSKEKAYMVIRTYEYFVEYLNLKPEIVSGMNVSRLSLMIPVLKKTETKEEAIEQMEEMQAMRHGEFVREIKQKTNTSGKPNVFWSEEMGRWNVQYYDNITNLQPLGVYEKENN